MIVVFRHDIDIGGAGQIAGSRKRGRGRDAMRLMQRGDQRISCTSDWTLPQHVSEAWNECRVCIIGVQFIMLCLTFADRWSMYSSNRSSAAMDPVASLCPNTEYCLSELS